MGLLKAKLAKYRLQLLEPTGKSGAKGEGFDVRCAWIIRLKVSSAHSQPVPLNTGDAEVRPSSSAELTSVSAKP